MIEMTHEEWREWFRQTTGRNPTILDTYRMTQQTKEKHDSYHQ